MWFVSRSTPDSPIVCRIWGELDATRAGQLREVMRELAHYKQVVVDLGDVRFMDSAALGALIGGLRRIREQRGKVAIGAVRPNVARLLRTVGLDRLVPVEETIEKATAAVGAPTAVA
jgi:anti-sigma B factor antagonist